MKIYLIILPLDGGGLRWGWTECAPPHPRPLPQGEREMTGNFPCNFVTLGGGHLPPKVFGMILTIRYRKFWLKSDLLCVRMERTPSTQDRLNSDLMP